VEVTKSQKRLFIILGLVVAYAIYDFSSNADTYKRFYSTDEESYYEEPIDNSVSLPEQTEDAKTEVHYNAEWGRDPFYISGYSKGKTSKKKSRKSIKLSLHAISYNGDSYVALINNKIIKKGDMIAGYTVNKITDAAVYLSSEKKKIVLKLKIN